MKKILFFALALVASVVAFTGCKNDKDKEPGDKDAVVLNATGELRGVMFDSYNAQQEAVITLHTKTNTIDVKFVQARLTDDSETPQDVYIYGMPVSTEEGLFAHINLVLEDGSAYKPFSKSYAYAAMNAERTTFGMHFGNDDEKDTQVYLVYHATLKSEKEEDNTLTGTWQHTEDYGDARSEVKVIFEESNKFTYSDYKYMGGLVHYGYILNGTYKIDKDIVTVHYAESLWTNDGIEINKQEDFSMADEQMKYSISGNTLTIIRLYGTGSAYTETYTKQ